MRFLKIVFLASETRARVLRDLGDDLASIMLPHPRTWTAAVRQLTNYMENQGSADGTCIVSDHFKKWPVSQSGPFFTRVRTVTLFTNLTENSFRILDSDGLPPDVR